MEPILTQASLPAGGRDPERFDWQAAWYPVFYLDDLDPTRLARFTLLERDLVIWWDPRAETWRAFEDRCPHRLAPLSEGRVNEAGQLECPYHGWTFAGDGACQQIPQQPADAQAQTSARACATALPTTVRQGLLFVYAGSPDEAASVPVPVVEPLGEPLAGWTMLNTFRDLPYDALTLLENVLDVSHIPYTHHKTVGNRANAGPVELQVTESGQWGFRGVWPEGPRKGTLGRQDTTFLAPALMWHDLTSKQFGRTLTVVYATPIRKGECRLFARFPFQFPSKLPALAIGLTPRWYSHIGQNRVLEDDQIFLHDQERSLAASQQPYAKACYLPTAADKFVFEFRAWVSRYQADPFPDQSLPPRLTTEALMDRYHSHTQHCASCRGALTRIQQWQNACLIGGLLALAAAPLVSLLGFLAWLLPGLILAAGTAWLGLNRLKARFYQGNPVPPRNL
jgi:phenylpropionate dioxygenase-like ring-hydroxylating dioxygenase large terminal subunit